MRRNHKTQSLISEINITPFTDVILVLLIIFMITTPLISQTNIEIKLPEANSKATMQDRKPVYITITQEGVVYFENKVVTGKELKKKIDVLVGKDPDLKVYLAADQACRFQEVVKVVDSLKESGVTSLNIVTKTVERIQSNKP